MQDVMVVGFTGSPSSEAALWRAQQLARHVHVLTDTGRPLPDDTVLPAAVVHAEHVRRLFVEDLFDAAAAQGGHAVAVGDDFAAHGKLLRAALRSASGLFTRDIPLACLLVARPTHPSGMRPYRRVVAGADGNVGSGLATLAAAEVAVDVGAVLQVAAVERRRDPSRRQAFDAARASGGTFDPESFRVAVAQPSSALREARALVEEAGVSAEWEYHDGDPTEVIVAAVDQVGNDLLVTALMGVRSKGQRLSSAGRVTLSLLANSTSDHLIVLDPITLGVTPLRKASHVMHASASSLLGVNAP